MTFCPIMFISRFVNYCFITFITVITHLLQLNKHKTNLFEEYVNFVDNTKKRKKSYGYVQLYLYL